MIPSWRFLRSDRSGPGDYTRDRMQWQKNLTVEQVVASISGGALICAGNAPLYGAQPGIAYV
jgi:hypothetical protein